MRVKPPLPITPVPQQGKKQKGEQHEEKIFINKCALSFLTVLALWLDIFKSCSLSAEEIVQKKCKAFSHNIVTDN